jgi:PAS domain S-box-containing protein
MSKLSYSEYLERILAVTGGNIYWLDQHGVYQGCNNNVAKFFGMNSSQDVIGKTDIELVANRNQHAAESFRADDFEVMKTGKAKYNVEEPPYINQEGNVIHFLTTRVPIMGHDGEIVGVVGTSIDITERKKTEQALLMAKEQASDFNKLALQVAHDMRSPLAALSVLTEMSKTMPEEDRLHFRAAVQRLHDIADGLLSQHRAQQGVGDESHVVRMLVSTAILSVLAEKRLQYQGGAIQFDFIGSASDYFACVNANRVNFKRMISNMLNNAVEALENAAGIIRIALKTDQQYLMITISDTGIGMTAEQVQSLMSDRQLQSSKPTGHGLGFAHAKETLQKSQATFWIESQLNQGTTITLQFPLQKIARYLESEIRLTQGCMVVVLDDDPSVHGAWGHCFKDILNDYPSISMKHFTDGQACIDFLSSQRDHKILLLTDYELINQPMNGLDVISQVNVEQAVLVTSYYEDTEIIARVISLGTKIIPKLLISHIGLTVI